MSKPETIMIDDQKYVRADCVIRPAEKTDGMDYVIIRSSDAGCFAGSLKAKNGNEVELVNARRLWYWKGAASLSQLAMEGVTKPNDCKFPPIVDNITVLGVCEIIHATEKAKTSISGVKIWRA